MSLRHKINLLHFNYVEIVESVCLVPPVDINSLIQFIVFVIAPWNVVSWVPP